VILQKPGGAGGVAGSGRLVTVSQWPILSA
jgi:hypothetical protein